MQQAGEQTREGINDVNRLNFTKNATVAGMTRPILTQTGSTSSGTGQVTQSQSPWATVAQVGASAAPLSL